MKVVCGLGNPGEEYAATRHNVGWWVVDAARRRWGFPAFRREGRVRVSEGRLHRASVRLLKPTTFMNRSGAAVAALRDRPGFAVSRDLLVVVDDAALEVGRVRLRTKGTSGGHNGLKSVEAALGTQEYTRLRVGVGVKPESVDLADWVLDRFTDAGEEVIRAMLPDLVDAVEVWLVEGADAAANRFNR